MDYLNYPLQTINLILINLYNLMDELQLNALL